MVELSIFSVIVFIFMINTILDHLFNWWLREQENDPDYVVVIALVYLFKIIILLVIIANVTP